MQTAFSITHFTINYDTNPTLPYKHLERDILSGHRKYL